MRGLGHIADLAEHVEEDLAKRHVGSLIGAPRALLPLSVDYSPLLGTVPDQGATSSCVGFAFATSIYLRAKIAGHPIPRPSSRAIYDIARLEDSPRETMRDEGSRPRAAVNGLLENGMVADERWPLDAPRINELPPLDVFQHGLAAMLGGWYRIASGPGAATLVRLALARGFCPAFAMPVDQSFEDLGSEVYDAPAGPSLGQHMQCFCGFGPGYLLVAGSWGPGYFAGGFARVSDAFVDRGATDILVPTVVPLKVS